MAWFRVDVPPSGGGGSMPDQIAKIAQGTTFDYSELETKTVTIPQYVFHGSQIRDVESTDVITVQDRAFEGCTNLRKINLPNCTSIGSYAFACNRTTYASTVSINLPAVTNISAYAFNGFYGTDNTSEIAFPACTYIGQYAFQHTSSNPLTIKSLSFPVVTQMGGSSFVRIIAETLDIGENCTSMGSTPLANATVTNLIIRATTPPTLGTNAGLGNGASIAHIYVPDGTDPVSGKTYVQIYKDANRWSQYASYIEAIPS